MEKGSGVPSLEQADEATPTCLGGKERANEEADQVK